MNWLKKPFWLYFEFDRKFVRLLNSREKKVIVTVIALTIASWVILLSPKSSYPLKGGVVFVHVSLFAIALLGPVYLLLPKALQLWKQLRDWAHSD